MSKAPLRLIGQIRDVRIEAGSPNSLKGALIDEVVETRGGELSTRAANEARRANRSTLEFPNNAALAALGGAHQKNFVRIEQKLGVRVATRGNLVAVEGAPDAREQAAPRVARALCAHRGGRERSACAEVDAEIRFAPA